jgi:hypothetical protein
VRSPSAREAAGRSYSHRSARRYRHDTRLYSAALATCVGCWPLSPIPNPPWARQAANATTSAAIVNALRIFPPFPSHMPRSGNMAAPSWFRASRVARRAIAGGRRCPMQPREPARLRTRRWHRRNHASTRPVPKAWSNIEEGSIMSKVLTIFALLVGLTACHVGGGFGIGANDHQPTRVASAE